MQPQGCLQACSSWTILNSCSSLLQPDCHRDGTDTGGLHTHAYPLILCRLQSWAARQLHRPFCPGSGVRQPHAPVAAAEQRLLMGLVGVSQQGGWLARTWATAWAMSLCAGYTFGAAMLNSAANLIARAPSRELLLHVLGLASRRCCFRNCAVQACWRVLTWAMAWVTSFCATSSAAACDVIHRMLPLLRDRLKASAHCAGLLEGAHMGHGLGHEFLRHIQRCRMLVHVLDGTSQDALGDYRALRTELELFNPMLADKPQVCLSHACKADLEHRPGTLVHVLHHNILQTALGDYRALHTEPELFNHLLVN